MHWDFYPRSYNMAKNKKRSNKNGGKQPRKGAALVQSVVRRGADRMAKAYYNLLLDPCNAPLAYPVYGGSDGSYLAKFESYFTVGAGVTSSASNGFLWWSPGTTNTAARSFLVTGTATTSGGAITWATASDLAGSEPGSAFLRTSPQASAYRAVAACAEISTLETELARSGHMTCGVVSNSSVYGINTSADALSALNQQGGRVPDGKLEVVWRPNEAAGFFVDPTDAVAAQQVERHNGILITWAGLPATSIGFRVKLTLVAEWKPRQATGITAPATPLQSGATMVDLMQFMAANSDKFIRWGTSAVGAFRATQRLINNARGSQGYLTYYDNPY